jgi:arylsulfatase A-like enzyme
MASAMDLFNTSLALAGAPLPQDRPLDGVDMSAILLSHGQSKREVHYYYYGDQVYAVRKGAFKAHFITHDGYSKAKAETHAPPLLYNLREDPSERTDVAAAHPEIVAELTRLFENHKSSVTHGKLQF